MISPSVFVVFIFFVVPLSLFYLKRVSSSRYSTPSSSSSSSDEAIQYVRAIIHIHSVTLPDSIFL